MGSAIVETISSLLNKPETEDQNGYRVYKPRADDTRDGIF